MTALPSPIVTHLDPKIGVVDPHDEVGLGGLMAPLEGRQVPFPLETVVVRSDRFGDAELWVTSGGDFAANFPLVHAYVRERFEPPRGAQRSRSR